MGAQRLARVDVRVRADVSATLAIETMTAWNQAFVKWIRPSRNSCLAEQLGQLNSHTQLRCATIRFLTPLT
jgi:hypothetical protein